VCGEGVAAFGAEHGGKEELVVLRGNASWGNFVFDVVGGRLKLP
jgi:hypothetical protein